MRFLVDECLSSTLAALLRADGHDAVHVVDLGHGGSDDGTVMRLARDQRRVVLSADTDFGELLARGNDSEPSVVLFRGNEVDSPTLAGLLRANLEQLEDSLTAGAIVVILDDRIRVRGLPLNADRRDKRPEAPTS